jgi:hypothetical protein
MSINIIIHSFAHSNEEEEDDDEEEGIQMNIGNNASCLINKINKHPPIHLSSEKHSSISMSYETSLK